MIVTPTNKPAISLPLMSALQENPGLNAELIRIAQAHVDTARQNYAMTFDYSEQSLRWVDDAIAKFQANGSAQDDTIIGFGAYVGETIRRSLGGIWVQDERGVALLQRVGGRELSASPFSWVQQRFAAGIEESVAAKFAGLKSQIGQTGVRIASSKSAQPAAGGSQPTEEESELLARAPLIAFMLVAASDGKLDRKELESFNKIVMGVLSGDCPPLRKAVTDMLPQLERFFKEMGDRNLMEDLQRVATVVDRYHPNEAEAFKHGLVGIAIEVANSSGGFLGFGSKISKDEKLAIAGIAVALGLAGEE